MTPSATAAAQPRSTPSRARAVARSSVLTIDVEDWFQVENLKPVVPAESWPIRELRVERNMDRMLQAMDDAGARATCFILGWIAERMPRLVQRIAEAGHEVASHGYGHELVYRLSPESFRADVERSRYLLQDLSGQRVDGYRAPSFSITEWAIDILQETGYRYDSSVFPVVAHDRYGRLEDFSAAQPIAELRPGFWEVGVSCLRLGGRGVPWGGGGYFRLLPYPVFRRGIERIQASGAPFVFYIHPWEIDDAQPRVRGLSRLNHFRHYHNLHRCEDRFEALLQDFRWGRVVDVLGARARLARSAAPEFQQAEGH